MIVDQKRAFFDQTEVKIEHFSPLKKFLQQINVTTKCTYSF